MASQTTKTKKLAVLAMLSALSFLLMIVGRIPVVLFLKYDPKDIVIAIGAFLYGPLAGVMMSVTVSFAEMVTVSGTGFIGFIMNIISTCAFVCTAALIYKSKNSIFGAVFGLIIGTIATTTVMLIWNYLLTPLYMGVPREAVVELLVPYILPFNLLKGGLNSAIIMLVYKPIRIALQKSNLLQQSEQAPATKRLKLGVMITSMFVIVTCILVILSFQNRI